MLARLKSIAKNPKVQNVVLSGAASAAAVYGGPVAAQAVRDYLPKLAALLGL